MRVIAVILSIIIGVYSFCASGRESGPPNRPYSDNRAWHAGFYVGSNLQSLKLSHGIGADLFVEQPGYSPGFNVGGVIDFRLNDYFNLRFSPGLIFGNRDMKIAEPESDERMSQNIKRVFVSVPVDLKFSSIRYRNSRPYITAGVMPAVDVSKKRTDYIKLKSFDCYLTVGLGCDFYLPFFKLNPELKFCFGLADIIEHNRPDLSEEPERLKVTQGLRKGTSKMIVLSFYFE